MRLRRLDLTRYGKFTDKVIDFGEAAKGQPDFHIVYGLNEAGKSTAFSAWLDLLFGIHPKSQYNFLHPYEAMQIGGVIEAGGETHELIRTKKKQNALTDQRGQPLSEALIASALGGIGRDAYRTMFSLDDQSLKEGGEDILKSEGDLGALLFQASAGLADICKTLAALKGEADTLYRARASSTELARLKSELSALKDKRAQIDTQASAYAALSEAEAEAREAHAMVEAELADARRRQGELNRLLKALPAASDLQRVDTALAGLAGLPRPSPDLAARLPRLMQDETRLETRRRGLEENLDLLKRELDGMEQDDAILALSSRIAALDESRHRHRSAAPDLPRRRLELAEQEAALSLHLKALDRPNQKDAGDLILPARLVARLRDLIEQRSGIETALKTSAREAERVRGLLEEIEAERQSLGANDVDEDAAQRLSRLAERLQRSDAAAKLSFEERALAKLVRDADQALAALEPVSLEPESLKTLVLPDRRQFDRWRDQASDLGKRRQAMRDRIRSLETEEKQASARIKSVAQGAEVLDDATAAALRRERNGLWQAHLATLSTETAAAFETALSKDDAACELRLSRAHDLADLRQATQARALAMAALEREQALLAEVNEERERLAASISAAFPRELEVSAEALEDHVERLRNWSERHQRWLDRMGELEQAEDRIEELRHALRTGLDDLAGALSASGLAVPPKADAQALFTLADRYIAGIDKAMQRRADIERRERQLQEDMRNRAHEGKAARDAANKWQQEWETALAETWFAGEASIAAVRANLDALAELPALLRERDQLRHRIQVMKADQETFAAEVMDLCSLAGVSCTADTIRISDEALTARFETAQRAEDARAEKEKQIAARTQDLQALKAEIAEHEAGRKRLLAALDVEALAEADAQVERLKERDRLETRRRELAEQLLSDLRAPDLASAFEKLGTLDEAELEREQALLAERTERLSGEVQEIYGHLTLARSRLEAVGGDNAVAAIEAERATVLLAIEELALRYLKLRTGALAAGSALDLYREKHRSTMMKRASEAFRMITRGEYSGLSARPDKDRETLIGIPRDGGSRMADAMSTGTRYQLYLALRLAGYEEFARVSPPVPFIADDIMETFDELRSEEVFRLFGEMAGIGQVIYLTHHRHLCDIAKTVVPSVKIHQL